MARLSLCLVVSMLFGVPTCLVTSTTEFPQPVPSAPYLDPNTALATVEGETGVPLTKMIFVKPDSESSAPPPAAFKSITLSAQVQSEDNGRPLYARAFGDYQISKSPWFGGGDTLEPSTFEDVRTITATVTADQMHLLGLGCHQLALVVTHLFDSKTFKPVDSKDTGFVVWWILIRDPAGSTPAESCPPKVSVPDGGNMLEAGAQ